MYVYGVLFAVFFLSCIRPFSSFEEVESDFLKVIDIAYRNNADTTLSEAMPGESVRVLAYFAGEKLVSIRWRVSFTVLKSEAGTECASDIQDLAYETIAPPRLPFSDATQCIGIRFMIPRNILQTSPSVCTDKILGFGIQKDTLLTVLDAMASTDVEEWDSVPCIKKYLPFIKPNLPQLLQCASAPVQLFLTINGCHKIKSECTVRYNGSLYKKTGSVYANKNPVIDFLTVYKIKKPSAGSFDPAQMRNTDTTYCLYIRDSKNIEMLGKNVLKKDTLAIDEQYQYYLGADTGVFAGVDQRDTTMPFTSAVKHQERIRTLWFYQLDDNEKSDCAEKDLFSITTTGTALTPLIPSNDRRITHVTLWLQLYDSFPAEWLRPEGSAVMEKTIFFTYTKHR